MYLREIIITLTLIGTLAWLNERPTSDRTAVRNLDGNVSASILLEDQLATPIACGRPCVITFAPGGNLMDHRLEAQALRAKHVPIIVDGLCASACTVFLDEQRENVCLTTRAILGFHKASLTLVVGDPPQRFDIAYSRLIEAWIKDHGGLPTDDLLVASFPEASKLFKPCPGAVED